MLPDELVWAYQNEHQIPRDVAVSSFNIDSDVSGDEVQNLTMQWNYAVASGHKPRERHKRELLEIPRLLNLVVNAVCMLAGLATSLVAIAYATGLVRLDSFLQ